MKTIYIEPDEEIISVIDRVDRTSGHKVGLAIPKNAQLWQSSINLKLLKREADGSNKKIVLVIPADIDSEVAEKIGFEIKRVKDIQAEAELIRQNDEENDLEAIKPEEEAGSEVDDLISGDDEAESGQSEEKLRREEESEGEIKIETNNGEGAESKNKIIIQQASAAEISAQKQDMLQALVDKMEEDDDSFHDTFKESLTRDREAMLASYRKKSSNKLLDAFGKSNLFSKKSSRKSSKSKNSRSKSAKIQEDSLFNGRFFTGFVALAVVLIFLVIYFVLPTAKIEIFPLVETKRFDLAIVGLKDSNSVKTDSNNIVSLQEVKIEQTISQEFEATGKTEVNQKAKGIITIYNEYNSSPQTLVATTRFQSPDGKIFRIPTNIVIPGAKVENAKIVPSEIDAEVVADQPGEEYNIGLTDFTIPGFKGSPKYVGFYGKSKQAMVGGSVGSVKVVSADDLSQAEEKLKEELLKSAREALQKQVPDGFALIKNGVKEEIIQTNFSAQKNEAVEKFNLEIKLEIRALAYQKDDLKRVIDLDLLTKIENDKKLISESQKIDWTKMEIDWNKGRAELDLSVLEDISQNVDIAAIKSGLAGKNEIEARKYFSERPEIQKVQFSFWPFWVKSIPSKESRIKIEIVY